MNRYKAIYDRVMKEEQEAQEKYKGAIFELRGVEYPNLERFKAMFVPNNEFLKSYDPTVAEVSAGMYGEGGGSIWTGQLLFPVMDLLGDVRGFAAFDPFVYADVHGGGSGNYYAYSSGDLMSKKRFMLGAEGVYKRAWEQGYLCITDGIFDTVSLDARGVNAMALMGSSLTPEILFQLRFIKNVILVQDNDDAGLMLGDKLKRMHRGGKVFRQKYDKDFDGAVRGGYGDRVVDELRTFLAQSCNIRI